MVLTVVSNTVRPIGGFFGLGLLDIPPARGSIWEAWLSEGRPTITTWTARAALLRLIQATTPERIWMPAYLCREVIAVCPKSALRYYRLDDHLTPDVASLSEGVNAGDLVVGVNYFGWPPTQPFLDLVADRPDVIWVEDRTQCLWIEQPPWAPWILYSPRKLVGVPDGGILISRTNTALAGTAGAPADAALALPELMRFEDAAETDNTNWHTAFKAREARFSGEPRPMSQLTVALLQRTPIKPLVEARQRNFAYLEEELGEYRAWQRPASGITPWGFVITVDDAEILGATLARERLFCSRHWPPASLAITATEFPREHRLARALLTLPCDHRYDEAELARLVEAVRRLVPARE